MATFVVEAYLPDSATARESASSAATRLANVSEGIRYVRSLFLPGDETVLHVFEAASSADVIVAAARVDLDVDRITEAIEGRRHGTGRSARHPD